MRRLIPKSKYARNVLTLMTGTGLAQSVTIAISPILTRLYSPDEFGLFALYLALLVIVAVFLSGRYEQAILLPRKDPHALQIVVLVVLLSAIISGVLFVVIVLFDLQIASFLGNPKLAPFLYWLPVTALLLSVYESLSSFCNRKAYYKQLAISRVTQSSFTGGGHLLCWPFGVSGLVVGQIVGQLIGTGVLASQVLRKDPALISELRLPRIRALARKYINFPKYLIVAHGFNTASSQMLVLLLSALFTSTTVGLVVLTQRVLGAPITLIAGALREVFSQEASRMYIRQGNCISVYKKTFNRLFFISVIPYCIFFSIAPDLFAFVFGAKWRLAGEYAQILTPKFFFDFVASPLSAMFMIAQKQRLDLLWQVGLFLVVVGSILIGYFMSSVEDALMFYSAGYCFMQVISLAMSYSFASTSTSTSNRKVK